jgi:hypothetical protein
MKKISYCIVLVMINCFGSHAQQGKSVSVKAGDDLAQAYSPNGFYRFPQFSKAVLFRTSGKPVTGQLLNYDIYSAAMQFINEKGDTLQLINPSLFDSILIGESLFFYREGYLELAASSSSMRLLRKTRIRLIPEKMGAYGTGNPTGASDKITSFNFGNSVYNISVNENMTIKEQFEWFWMDPAGKLLKATKENLFVLLPAEKRKVAEDYLAKRKVNFGKESDLKKLIDAI